MTQARRNRNHAHHGGLTLSIERQGKALDKQNTKTSPALSIGVDLTTSKTQTAPTKTSSPSWQTLAPFLST
jgi:hypothetical protein